MGSRRRRARGSPLSGKLAWREDRRFVRLTEHWSNEHYFAFAREFGGQIMLGFHEGKTGADRERELQELLHDPSFQRHLALRYYGERDMAHQYGELLRQAEAVVAQVRAQMAPIN